jgi:hypothetical protein
VTSNHDAEAAVDPSKGGQPRSLIKGAIWGVLAVVGLLLIWLVITGALAAKAANDVRSQSSALISAMKSGDAAAIAASLEELQSSTATLDVRLNSSPWSQVADLPLVGRSVGAAASIAAGAHGVLAATEGQEQVIGKVVQQVESDGLAAAGSLRQLQPVTQAALDAMVEPAQAVEVAVAAGLPGPVQSVATEFLAAVEGVAAANAGTHVLPGMLGFGKDATWLVVFENLAEPRGTGGLITSFTSVRASRGQLSPGTAQTTNAIDKDQVSLAGIPADTRKLWGPDLAYSYGWNLDRHFPYAGQLALRSSGNPGGAAQYLLSLDAEAVAALLEVVGPVTVAGITIDATNAVDYFTRQIYEDFPNVERKDLVTLAFIDEVVSEFFGSELDLVALAEAIAEPARTGNVNIYSAVSREQRALAASAIGGAVPDSPGPWASVAINDNAGDKMAPYLDVKVLFESAGRCVSPGATSRVTATVTNRAPEDIAPYVDAGSRKILGNPAGSTRVGVAIYAPVGSAFRAAEVDGQETTLKQGRDRSHPVWAVPLDLNRGETKSFTVTFEEPRTPDLPIQFSRQPMVNPIEVALTQLSC